MLQLVRNIKPDTGEILSEKKKYIQDQFTEEGYKVPLHKRGAKTFSDIPFPAEMTDAEIGKMTKLAKQMVGISNMLGYRGNNRISPYTEKHLYEIIGLSDKRGKAFIKKMIRLGVMQKNIRIYETIKQEEYYINPAYFFAGKRISFNLYLLFREHLDKILPKWVIREYVLEAKERHSEKTT